MKGGWKLLSNVSHEKKTKRTCLVWVGYGCGEGLMLLTSVDHGSRLLTHVCFKHGVSALR
jgi:hypothetical protein